MSERYDEVREALLERGYLETPLERLFLGTPGPAGRGRLRAMLRAALLAGLIAGLPLGALLALDLVLQGGGLVPIWPDGVLYAALFAPMMGVLVALAELVVAFGVSLLAGLRGDLSPRRAAWLSGAGVAVLLALYLGSWWLASGPAFDPLQLGGLLLLGLGAGLSGRVVSAAILIQASLRLGRAPRLRRTPGRLALIGAGLAAVALVVVVSLALGRPAGGGTPVDRRAGAPGRAVLIGWDGLDAPLVRGLIERGRTPWLAELMRSGWLGEIEGGAALDPVAAWTSVATGSGPGRHGVRGAGLRGVPGASAPAIGGGLARGPLELLSHLLPGRVRAVRSGVRQTPALWEVTAQAKKTAVLGWWGTWPADAPGPAGGFVVSDFAVVAARRGEGERQAAWPAGWAAAGASRWLAGAERESTGTGIGKGVAREALVADLFVLEALDDALRDPELAAVVLYLPGLDILRAGLASRGVDPFGTLAAIETHAALVDARLATALDGWAGETGLIGIAGLPGRRGGDARGFLALEGGGVPPAHGAVLELLQVAPAWLTCAGYPVDERMEGRLPAALARLGERRYLTTARIVRGGSADPELEREALERLRSLGYLR